MNLGIMQPYFFPYIGYFQLINAVDKFVLYNDVNFIKQGWINRNRILSNHASLLFSIPLKNVSSFSKINQVYINEKLYNAWAGKFIKTIKQNYQKAPYFSQTFDLLQNVLFNSRNLSISDLASQSLIFTCKHIGIEKDFASSSTSYKNQNLSGVERVIDICKKENASTYLNPVAGQSLYKRIDFQDQGIQLRFIKPAPIKYRQFENDFVAELSIIDVLMFNSVERINHFLNEYEII